MTHTELRANVRGGALSLEARFSELRRSILLEGALGHAERVKDRMSNKNDVKDNNEKGLRSKKRARKQPPSLSCSLFSVLS
jgi:hypothetical protein